MLPSVHVLFHLLTTFTPCPPLLTPLDLEQLSVQPQLGLITLTDSALSSHCAQLNFKLHVWF